MDAIEESLIELEVEEMTLRLASQAAFYRGYALTGKDYDRIAMLSEAYRQDILLRSEVVKGSA